MDKLILIEGENPVLIQKEIDKIINKLTNYELIKYDLNEIEFNKIIEDLDTYDMFLKQKVIIGYNPLFLVEKTDFKEDKLLKYINNPSDNILILVVNKLNNRLKLVTEIKKVFKIITIKNMDYNTFIENNLEDYKMDKSTIQYFLNKVGQNYNIIESELEKLKLYKVDKKIITKEDIDLVSNRNIESSIFDLIDSIVKKDKKKVYELYEHFLSSGTEIIQIMIMLANQIRLIYNVKVLNRLSDSEISNLLEVHEYPVKLARNKGYNYSKKELLNMLYNLAILDEDIKSNKCLQNISFLTFIMQI